MCRRNQLRGCALMAFGLGVLIGYFLQSWFLCSVGGIVLVVIGWIVARKRHA